LLERIGSEGSPARALVSKVWRRYALRDIRANDNHVGLDKLYALPDPWGMTSRREQSRFVQTNEVIERLAGRSGSVLEIGCGEGHQSEYLAKVCDRLYGLDVSATAIARAQCRVPSCDFGVGHLSALPWSPPAGGKFDLVVACEVLYYLSDVDDAVRRMSELGNACLVTFFSPAARLVAEHLIEIPGLQRGWIYHDPYAWLWAYWKPADTRPE
jgi:2-polyprenyl-3-methyl-5-hydroxy-6-metoxy-1,4-benzoquinol methylase